MAFHTGLESIDEPRNAFKKFYEIKFDTLIQVCFMYKAILMSMAKNYKKVFWVNDL